MTSFSPRLFPLVRNGLTLALMCSMLAGTGWAASSKAGAAIPAGGLSITTDPDNATVYVDGRLAGLTPVHISAVTAGDHRVRIVKSGYLENVRMVSVPAGQPKSLQVKLTRATDPSNAGASQVTPPPPGGAKKWIIIAAAGGAAAGAGIYVATKNHPPIAGTISVSPTGTGMAGQTSFTFTAQGASDPDGDSLTFSWDFGDGATGSGANTSHTYNNAGSFTVALSVSDGKKSVSAPSTSVTVGPNLSGTWAGGREATFGCGISVAFSQNGTTLTGNMTFTSPCTGTITLASASASALVHPSTVTWTTSSFTFTQGTTVFPGLVIRFSGPTNTGGTSMTGTITTSQASSGFTQSQTTTLTK